MRALPALERLAIYASEERFMFPSKARSTPHLATPSADRMFIPDPVSRLARGIGFSDGPPSIFRIRGRPLAPIQA